jgi:peroxiredoxin
MLVILRLALSATFGVAAVTKFLDQDGARAAVKNFGAPSRFANAIAVLLPAVELSIAIGLLLSSFVWSSALAALLLLVLFVVAIGYNLKQGRTHDCHCFGQLYSRPLGWPTLARNLVFALGAGFIVWQQPARTDPGLLTLLEGLSTAQWLILIALAVGSAGALFYGYKRNQRESVNPSHGSKGLPVGTIAPDFELRDYAGGKMSLSSLLDYGRPLMLIFVSPLCGPCVAFFKEIGRWQREHDAELTIAIISKGTIKENFVNVARNGLRTILLQEAQEVAQAYGSNVTPSAVVVNAEGRIVSEVVAGSEEITKLLHTTLGDHPHTSDSRPPLKEEALLASN